MIKILVDRMPEDSEQCPFECTYDSGLCSLIGGNCLGAELCPCLVPHCMMSESNKQFTPNDYQKACLRTESVAPNLNNNQYSRILQGLMGLNGEAGECIDILKKVLFQGHDLDKERLAGELGDVAWYLAVSADAIGYDLETIFKKNIEKLNKRYPDGFDAEKSVHRSEGDV